MIQKIKKLKIGCENPKKNIIVGLATGAKINFRSPKCCSIWSCDTSISSSYHVVSDDIKIIALSFVVFKWQGVPIPRAAPKGIKPALRMKNLSFLNGMKWNSKRNKIFYCRKVVKWYLYDVITTSGHHDNTRQIVSNTNQSY